MLSVDIIYFNVLDIRNPKRFGTTNSFQIVNAELVKDDLVAAGNVRDPYNVRKMVFSVIPLISHCEFNNIVLLIDFPALIEGLTHSACIRV